MSLGDADNRPIRGIVRGQRVTARKRQFSKDLRQRMTPAETVLWKRLRGNRLHGLHFRRQQVIDGFIVDFYCHACRLVIEVDGPIHETQKDYDARRDRILLERGLRILQVTNGEVMRNLEGVLEEVHRFCTT